VREAAATTGAAAAQVLGAAGDLSQQSNELATELDGFLAGVRAA
jgi:methyl-accepting chemotaxis protein